MILFNIMIKALIYDMGDLLYDASGWRKWLYKFLNEELGIKITYTKLYDVWENLFLCKIHKNLISYKYGFNEFLDYLGLLKVQKEELLKINWDVKKEIEDKAKPFKHVKETLKKLKISGFINCILTDTELNSTQVWTKLNKFLQIGEYIDLVVSSSDINSRKPEKMAYQYCLDKMGLNKENVLFIGHDKDELDGANNFGIKTIAYNNNTDVKATYKIKDFIEILNIVDVK